MSIIELWIMRKGDRLISLIISILLSCVVPESSFSQSFPYKFNYLTVDEGLSHTDANYVAQDCYGYIWVATNFGLDRYDGYSVKNYYNKNIPLSNAFKNRIIHLFPDENGIIWLVTEDGLQCFDPKIEKYTDFTIKGSKVSPAFWKVVKSKENLIYGFADFNVTLYAVKGKFLEEKKLNPPFAVRFTDMITDRKGEVYFSSNEGIWTLDKNNRFVKIMVSGLPGTELSHLFFDNNNNLLVTSGNSVFLTEKQSSSATSSQTNYFIKKQFTSKNEKEITGIAGGKKPEYWLNTGSDLIRLDRDLNHIQTVNNKSSQLSLNSNVLGKAFVDRSECLWVCTSGGGINYCDLNQKLFYTLQHNPGDANSLSGNYIRSIVEEGENLWITTNVNGLNRYNLNTKRFTHYSTSSGTTRLKDDVVDGLILDKDGNLWIGSSKGIEILLPDRKTLWRPSGYEKFPKFVINTLEQDYYGNIWFGNLDNSGVIWKDRSNEFHVKYYAEGHYILADKKKPQLFVATRHGLKRIMVDAEGNIIDTFYFKASSKPNALSSDYPAQIRKQNDSVFWVGTIGGGLNRLALQTRTNDFSVKVFAENYGVFNDVETIEMDEKGNLWMGGNGLQCLDPLTGKLIRYDKNDGLQGNSFKIRASHKGPHGRLYFGGINGLNYFYPDEIKANRIEARPVLTNIIINNKTPEYSSAESSDQTISNAIGYGKKLKLSYLQNNFVISFSAMHFANPLKCSYRYQLVGYDKDWKYTDGKNPSAAYSNLDYSHYKFIVEATNNDGLWSKSQAETEIVVTPPWWKSEAAKMVYLLLFISALSGIYIYQARWYRLKREIEVRAINEKKREEMHLQREELYQQQLTFFTNISHEFRTPLTLILGPLESLISQNTNASIDNSYQLILRNARRMINLISELMNFKKISDSLIKLQVHPLNISKFCVGLVSDFQNLAASKNISLKMKDHTEKNVYWPHTGLFDVQVLEKILLNLLNNAIKYTQAGGNISFEIFSDIDKFKPSFEVGFQLLNENHRASKYLYFCVSDTGIGISSDAITRIFDRYYRIGREQLGSGVGLALVKSLTQLHKGDIYVYSEPFKGTEIIIGIPLGEENYSESERASFGNDPEVRMEPVDNSILAPLSDLETDIAPDAQAVHKHILLVDDNAELRLFLRQTFEKYYYIHEAEDGKSALEIASEKVPDLIISDVMMPGMSGIELCKLVKEQFETSHIPFVILSAKDALATKIEGLESGADYYFAKPLSVDLLLLTVHNIFERSEKLKLRYTKNYLSEATELVHSEKDKEFFQSLLALIEANIQEPDLDVEFLCKHLYISRTKLYQKIKSITDQSVGEFIRTIRLKKAIQIMTHEDIAMNKVVDRVGMQSSSNFSRAFKKEYGKSPLQFMQSLKKNSVSNS
ncbi:response regulator [Dyadobacter subterraneus]|uniref:histidine kinase n=1 Tax=Dyadobacter subterraneus TaxID=2773304 RepID=A0ABR9WDL4_9BACT|nr:response regulator [Dyadobacter subterraneus]MBE9463568.1 response regulator [Dyadobacter subterraneus]